MALVACTNQSNHERSGNVIDNPTVEQVLLEDKNADIFLLNDIVYINGEDVEWVNDLELTLGQEIGEIKKQSNDSDSFENFTATKLTVGSKIYETVEQSDIYIVKINDEEKRYLPLIEG